MGEDVGGFLFLWEMFKSPQLIHSCRAKLKIQLKQWSDLLQSLYMGLRSLFVFIFPKPMKACSNFADRLIAFPTVLLGYSNCRVLVYCQCL